MNGLQDFLKQNTWNLIITTVAIVIAFTTLNTKVEVVAQEHADLTTRLAKIEDLTERIVRLEEGRQVNAGDIAEIKADIKDIKEHFEIK